MSGVKERIFGGLAALLSGCGKLPLLAAVLLIGSTRITAALGLGRDAPLPPSAPVSEALPADSAVIDAVLAKRAPELGLILRGQLALSITEEARRAGYDPLLILAVIDVESDFEEDAISDKGARGLMQIRPSTLVFLAEKEGLRLTRDELTTDPAVQVRLGIRYLRQLQDRFRGDLDLALMAYNGGPTRLRQALKEREVEVFRRYTRAVRRNFRRFREGEGLTGDWALAQRDRPNAPDVAGGTPGPERE